MDIIEIIEIIIKDFSKNFVKFFLENSADNEENDYSKEELLDYRIFCNRWIKDTLVSIKCNDSEENNLSCEVLSSEILKYVLKLCKTEPIITPEIEMVHELDFYSLRAELLECFERRPTNKKFLFQKDFPEVFSCSRKMNNENFYVYFQILLELEDLEVLRDYFPLVEQGVYLDENDNGTFTLYFDRYTPRNFESIVKPNVDEAVIIPLTKRDLKYSSIKEKHIHILTSHIDEESIIVLVTKVSKTNVTFELSDDKYRQYLNLSEPVDIVYRPQRRLIRYQHRALELLQANKKIQQYLFPKYISGIEKPEATLTSFELINDGIARNPEQLEAVQKIVFGPNSSAPYIIFGPPGTGKTTTIVESILQLRLQHPESRILVTAGSNAACDTIAMRLCEHFEKSPLLRKHLNETSTFPMLRIFSTEILRRENRNLPEELLIRSNVSRIKRQSKKEEVEKYTESHVYPTIEEIHKYGVIITTLCTVGKLVCGGVGETNYFTHVFIDEAGASCEPEALIGIMGIKNSIENQSCHVILSGDHKQLGPVIKSDMAEELGLGKSLMERLLEAECYAVNSNGEYDRSLQMRLRRNYRSHPEIVRLYNHLYYNDELVPMLTENDNSHIHRKWSLIPNTEFPILFQNIYGEMTKEGTKSSCNKLEIENVIKLISHLTRYDSIEQKDIGVITPYKLQVKHIKKEFKERNWVEIDVGSVENFQGREKFIIIASMVRSNSSLGFVKCPRRLNVLLSRPIALLIILGDSFTLNGCEDFQFIIDECKANGNFLSDIELLHSKESSFDLSKTDKQLYSSEFPLLTSSRISQPHSIQAKGQNAMKEKVESNKSFEQWALLRSQAPAKSDEANKKTSETKKGNLKPDFQLLNKDASDFKKQLSSDFPTLGTITKQTYKPLQAKGQYPTEERNDPNKSFQQWTVLRSKSKLKPDNKTNTTKEN